MSRNRILNSNTENQLQYINVPILKAEQNNLIKDARVNNTIDWKNRITGQLTGYKRLKAPYYDVVLELIENAFVNQKDSLVELNISLIQAITSYLGVNYVFERASCMNLSNIRAEKAGDWALLISSELNASEYINPYSGFEIFDEAAFKKNGINLRFLVPNLSEYPQAKGRPFTKGLSIIDVLMFNSKSEIVDMLTTDFTLVDTEKLKKLKGNFS